nr:external alternative NAD(P)H-ubiquinone oxidoreductase B1, mitochondrial [Ipomoea batatas]
MKVKATAENVKVPHGMVVWSTGVGTRPVVTDFMEQIGQTNRRALATDEWLRVKGCEGAYALGDCATVDQRKIMEDITTIFKAADKDNSGTLTVDEFEDVIEDIIIRYPQVELYVKSKHLLEVVDLLRDYEGNKQGEIDIEGFKLALSHVDSQTKSLPATAQVSLSFFRFSPFFVPFFFLPSLSSPFLCISLQFIVTIFDLLGCCTTRRISV